METISKDIYKSTGFKSKSSQYADYGTVLNELERLRLAFDSLTTKTERNDNIQQREQLLESIGH